MSEIKWRVTRNVFQIGKEHRRSRNRLYSFCWFLWKMVTSRYKREIKSTLIKSYICGYFKG